MPRVAALGLKKEENGISFSWIKGGIDVNKPGFDLNSPPVPERGLVLALGTEDAGCVRSPQLA